jgi:DNA-binding MurR/RpiR family transcriptional regulator
MRLKQLLPALRPSESRVAEFVLEEPLSTSRLTISELSSRCGTSLATVMRLCKRAGFDGYRSFRQALTVAAVADQDRRIDFGVSNGDIDLADPAVAVYRKMAFEEAQAVQDTITMLDFDVVANVVEALDKAPRIDVYGQASSGLAAQDLQQKLSRIGRPTSAWCDPHLALVSAATLPKDSVAIAFSHSGQTRETVRALRAARQSGALCVAITNYGDSPITTLADLTITTVSKETRFRYAAMPSRMAQLIIVDVLFMGVARLHPEETQNRLAKTFAAVRGEKIADVSQLDR